MIAVSQSEMFFLISFTFTEDLWFGAHHCLELWGCLLLDIILLPIHLPVWGSDVEKLTFVSITSAWYSGGKDLKHTTVRFNT